MLVTVTTKRADESKGGTLDELLIHDLTHPEITIRAQLSHVRDDGREIPEVFVWIERLGSTHDGHAILLAGKPALSYLHQYSARMGRNYSLSHVGRLRAFIANAARALGIDLP